MDDLWPALAVFEAILLALVCLRNAHQQHILRELRSQRRLLHDLKQVVLEAHPESMEARIAQIPVLNSEGSFVDREEA